MQTDIAPVNSAGAPLFANNVLIDSLDLHEAQMTVADIFIEHRLSTIRDAAPRRIRVSHKRLNALSLCHFDYGRVVTIDPDPFEDFYLLQIPEEGSINIDCGRDSVECKKGGATILPVRQNLKMAWSEDAQQTIVRIDRAKLVKCAEKLLGEPVFSAPIFHLKVDWSMPSTELLRNTLATLIALASSNIADRSRTGYDLLISMAEEAFLSTLLLTQPSDISDALEMGRLSSACPKQVQRAQRFINSHLAEPITIADLVEASGVPARTLFDSFRRFRGVSPMRYLRHQRLMKVREELLAGDLETTVTEVAMKWGFSQLGRFSGEYARNFGQAPSQTLYDARHSLQNLG